MSNLGFGAELGRAEIELKLGHHEAAAESAGRVLDERRSASLAQRLNGHQVRAQAHCLRGERVACERDVAALLDILPELESLPKSTVEVLTRLSFDLGMDCVLDLIQHSRSAELLLPLATALQREVGQDPRVAREVEEVAQDIRRDLARLRARATEGSPPAAELVEPYSRSASLRFGRDVVAFRGMRVDDEIDGHGPAHAGFRTSRPVGCCVPTIKPLLSQGVLEERGGRRCGTIAATWPRPRAPSTRTTRRRPSARRLRALRLLPAAVPDLQAVEPRDGLAPRADSPHEGGPGGKSEDHAGVRAALRHLPRLHGLPHRVSLRRAVRQAGGSRAAADRAGRRASAGRPAVPPVDLLAVPLPRPVALGGAEAVGLSAPGIQRLVRASGLLNLLPARLRAMEAVAPSITFDGIWSSMPAVVPAQGERRRRVAMLLGCVQRVFFSDVNAATARVLAAEGCDVVIPRAQGCCGALMMHSGLESEAEAMARRFIDAFEPSLADVDAIVINAAGCGSTLKEYGTCCGTTRGTRRARRRWPTSAAMSRRCWPSWGARTATSRPDARRLPRCLPPAARAGGERRAAPRAEGGSRAGGVRRAGGRALLRFGRIYNLVEPEAAGELGARKAKNVCRTGADAIVSSNPGCLLQLGSALEREGRPLPTMHLVELVDASIRGRRLTGRRGRGRGSADRPDRTGA